METGENSPFRSLNLSASWPQVKDQFEHEAALDFSVLSVGCGSVAAAGKRILSVCFGEITPDCYRQIRGLRISPQKPGNSPKQTLNKLG
jgi:hypothetical protein